MTAQQRSHLVIMSPGQRCALSSLLDASAALHHHLCPRQVLGVRMGMLAGEVLGLDFPQSDKRLLAIVETDGCFSDGIAVATNCWVGRRTMRVEDYGKVAATFVDTVTGHTIRIAPCLYVRERAHAYAPAARNKWEAQLLGYQRMPAGELLSVQTVQLNTPIEQIISRAGRKAVCEVCDEEIINQREVIYEGTVLCRACAGQGYYQVVADSALTHEQADRIFDHMSASAVAGFGHGGCHGGGFIPQTNS